MFDQFLKKADELLLIGESFAIATVVRYEAPISGKPGDKAIIFADGEVWGWIGGGCAQPAVVKEALNALKDGRPRLVRISPSSSQEEGIVAYNMTCHSGGTLDIYIEPVLPKPHILILGRSPAGDYTVTGHVAEGVRPGEQANCTAGFRVHAYEPPAITCSANPSTVLPGDPSTITSIASSPQNRPLSYSYSASSGEIASNTATATLVTTGTLPGTINVTCTVVDDLGKQATANTSVTITTPPPPPTPKVINLCSISFERDRKRPVRVDNEAKGCLDEIALTLNRESSAKLVIVGRHSADESPDAAAQRDLNVQQYLTQEKGIDPLRIELRTGGEPGRSLDSILIPAGASFVPGDTSTFDSNSVKRQGQPYAMPKTRH